MAFVTRTALKLFLLLAACSFAWAQYVISTYAGGAPPPTPVAGVNASLGLPAAVAIDAAGKVYFSSLDCVAGDGGPATSAQLTPLTVAVDSANNL